MGSGAGARAEKLGVVVNARARRVARHPELVGRLSALLPEGNVRITHELDEVAPALESLRARGIEALAIVGGDGSSGGTLTRALDVWPAGDLPDVLLAGGGTVNTIAKSLGARGSPLAVVERWLRSDSTSATARPLVRVCGDDRPARHGMIFAAGAATRFLEVYYGDSRQGVVGALSVIARALGSSAIGGALARRLFEPIRADLSVDGRALPLREVTVLGAANVRDVGLGFRPFKSAGSAPDRIHFVASRGSAAQLCAELPRLRLGLASGSCLLHHSAREVRVRFAEPQAWTLDADLDIPAERLAIRAGPRVRFLDL